MFPKALTTVRPTTYSTNDSRSPKWYSKSESKRKRGRPVKYTMPEPIDATPEGVAKAILPTPPKKPHEWQFMQGYKGDIKDLER